MIDRSTSRLFRTSLLVSFGIAILLLLCPSSLTVSNDKRETRVQLEQRVALGKDLFLEIEGKQRRVWLATEVCLRKGDLELLLTTAQGKEHEAILATRVDPQALHAALLAAGAKPGTPMKFQPRFQPARGQTIEMRLQYVDKEKERTVLAREWIKEKQTGKGIKEPWVFAGSQLVPNPQNPNAPPLYGARDGDLVSVSNFEMAILDIPARSTTDSSKLRFEAFTEKIPPLRTKVWMIFEPVP